MMRVFFLTRWYPTETKPAKGLFVREHARAASLFNDVTVLHLAGPDPELEKAWRLDRVEDPELTYGLPTYRATYRPPELAGTEYLRFLTSGMRAMGQVKRKLGPWDIIHAHEFDAAFLAVLLRWRWKVPIVATEHSTLFPRRELLPRAVRRARYAFARCELVMPVSQSLKEAIIAHGVRARFQVVPNAVDTALFAPLPVGMQKDDSPSRTRHLTVVSRLNGTKGIPTLLEACALLRAERGGWKLDIIGDGPGREEYEARIRAFGLEGKVRLRGLQPRHEVARYLQHSDLHIVPSNQETFSVVAVEALACGTPVVATRSGGPEEFVTKGTGLLVEPGDPEALAEAILKALEETFESAESIAKHARDLFSHDSVGKQLHQVYELA